MEIYLVFLMEFCQNSSEHRGIEGLLSKPWYKIRKIYNAFQLTELILYFIDEIIIKKNFLPHNYFNYF